MKLSELLDGYTIDNTDKIRRLEKEIKILKKEKAREEIEKEAIKEENIRNILLIVAFTFMILELIVICLCFT